MNGQLRKTEPNWNYWRFPIHMKICRPFKHMHRISKHFLVQICKKSVLLYNLMKTCRESRRPIENESFKSSDRKNFRTSSMIGLCLENFPTREKQKGSATSSSSTIEKEIADSLRWDEIVALTYRLGWDAVAKENNLESAFLRNIGNEENGCPPPEDGWSTVAVIEAPITSGFDIHRLKFLGFLYV